MIAILLFICHLILVLNYSRYLLYLFFQFYIMKKISLLPFVSISHLSSIFHCRRILAWRRGRRRRRRHRHRHRRRRRRRRRRLTFLPHLTYIYYYQVESNFRKAGGDGRPAGRSFCRSVGSERVSLSLPPSVAGEQQ